MNALPLKHGQTPAEVIDDLIANHGLKTVLLTIMGKLVKRTRPPDSTAGLDLRASVAAELEALTPHVEHIGSSAVVGLLAKPIVDLAVGSTDDAQWRDIRARLEALDWIYRGDAGDEGGHVFVLDAREWFRVAHLHVVLHEGMQWQNYLRFRDRLRSDPAARARYEDTKLVLASRHSNETTPAHNMATTKECEAPRWPQSSPYSIPKRKPMTSKSGTIAMNALANMAAVWDGAGGLQAAAR